MKTNIHRRKSHPSLRCRPYPNAADPSYFVDKLVDGILAVATGIGAATIFFYLITM